MGGCFSSSSTPKLSSVRLVHLSGYVEDFEQPITVSHVTGTPPKHFVCTSIQLLSSNSKPLKGDTQLQPGHVYFMLPYSVLQSDASPVDLASLAKRLTSIAKTATTARARRGGGRCNDESALSAGGANSPFWGSPCRGSPLTSVVGVAYGGRSPCRWRPILDTIREKSFNRRSESDLQHENN